MSKENLEQFIQQISDSEELQTRIGDKIDAESLIALGAEHGCEFTAEELQEAAELSDEELEGVAGGLLDKGGIYPARNNKLISVAIINANRRPGQLGADPKSWPLKLVVDKVGS